MPNGMRMVRLKDLLPEKVLDKLAPLLNAVGTGRSDPLKAKNAIVALLDPLRADLEAKGVLVEYLAYYLLHLALRGPGGDLHDVTLN